MLPLTPDEVLTGAEPVKPTTLMDMQEWICNLFAGKHAEEEHLLSPDDFVPATGVAADMVLGDQWTSTGFAMAFRASLSFLAVGDRITSIKCTYIVGAGNTVTVELVRRNMTTGAAVETVGAALVDADGTTIETDPLATLNHTIAAGYWYAIRFRDANGGATLYGASVKADRLA